MRWGDAVRSVDAVRGVRATTTSRSLQALALALLLMGCSEPKVGVSIVGYNHTTDRSIYYFTVNGSMGASLFPETGGGGYGCCVALPAKWRPGLKARIVWHYSDGTEIPVPPPSQIALVDVPDYGSNVGVFNVHFYPDQKIGIAITDKGIRHPEYPVALKWDMPTPLPFVARKPEPDVPRFVPEFSAIDATQPSSPSMVDMLPPIVSAATHKDVERKQ